MSLPRALSALTLVPLVLAAGVYACGGRVAGEHEGGASLGGDAATPTSTSTSTSTGTSTGTSTSPTSTTTGTSPTTTSTATGPAPTGSVTALTPDITNCSARTDCDFGGGGYVTDIVDNWMYRILDACAHPTSGAPPALPACGMMKVTFSRPDGAGCAQTVSFSTPEPPEFVACLSAALAVGRCHAGLFLAEGGTFDTRTFALCR